MSTMEYLSKILDLSDESLIVKIPSWKKEGKIEKKKSNTCTYATKGFLALVKSSHSQVKSKEKRRSNKLML
jgi:hypothetical protein